MWPQYPNDLVLVVLLALVHVSPPGFLCQRRLWAGCATHDSAGINGFKDTIHCWTRSELRTDGQDIVAWTEHIGGSWKLISTSADGTRRRREYRRYSMILWHTACCFPLLQIARAGLVQGGRLSRKNIVNVLPRRAKKNKIDQFANLR